MSKSIFIETASLVGRLILFLPALIDHLLSLQSVLLTYVYFIHASRSNHVLLQVLLELMTLMNHH
uniref:Uncharacterized protein n=1 Tax=Arundo donax TaxID=35708 RepID=A0A0A9F929_ARUDO